jgi:hypothetical protein
MAVVGWNVEKYFFNSLLQFFPKLFFYEMFVLTKKINRKKKTEKNLNSQKYVRETIFSRNLKLVAPSFAEMGKCSSIKCSYLNNKHNAEN